MIQNTIYSSSHLCVSLVAFFKYSLCGPTARTGAAMLKDSLPSTLVNGDKGLTACVLMDKDKLPNGVGNETKANRLSTTTYPEGVYLLKIQQKDAKVETVKFIVKH
jgi:hypothetical protein